MQRHREKTAIYRIRKEDSEENVPGNTLMSEFWPLEVQESKVLFLTPLSVYFCYGSSSK